MQSWLGLEFAMWPKMVLNSQIDIHVPLTLELGLKVYVALPSL